MSDVTEQELTNVPLQFEKAPHQIAPRSETQLAVQASDARRSREQQEIELLTEKISAITGKDWLVTENVPSIAYVLTKIPGLGGANGATISYTEAIAMAWTAVAEQANPFMGHIYRTGPYKFSTDVQCKIDKLRRMDIKIGTPKFTATERPWPAGTTLLRWDRTVKPWKAEEFKLPMEPGMICEVTVGGVPFEYTAWYIEHYVDSNPQWFLKRDRMLRVRALDNATRWGGCEGVSEAISKDEDVKVEEVETPKIKVSK